MLISRLCQSHSLFLLPALLLLSALATAEEKPGPDQLRSEAHAMQREAEQLMRNGHAEEAEQLQRNAQKMLHLAEQLIQQHARHREAAVRDVQQHLARLQNEIREASTINGPDHPRIRGLMQQAELAEAELHELTHDGDHHDGDHHEDRDAEIHELHRHIERLRNHERELTEHHGDDHPELREIREQAEHA